MKQTIIRNGVDFYRITNDVDGNPRYVFHFLNLSQNYTQACVIARKFGGRRYRAKWYGGGIVVSSYNLSDLAQDILSHRIAIGAGAVSGKVAS